MARALNDRETTFWRAAGVVVGVAGFIPWLWLLVAIIRRGDELYQRIHLLAIAMAAAFGLLLLIAIGWLERAGFIESPDFMLIWVVWLVA